MRRTVTLVAMLVMLIGANLSCTSGNTPSVKATPSTKVLDGLVVGDYLDRDPSVKDVTREIAIRHLNIVAPYTRVIYKFNARPDTSHTLRMAHEMGIGTIVECSIGAGDEDDTIELDYLIKECLAGNVNIAVAGDEVLQSESASVGKIMEVMKQLKGTGVRVTTCEYWKLMLAHPELGAKCDVIMVSAYPWWEGQNISKSLKWLKNVIAKLKKAYPGKEIWIVTAWPTGGGIRGEAVASPENAARYLKEVNQWRKTSSARIVFFEAFDEPWKAKGGVKAEAYWGIWDRYERLKPGMAEVLHKN